MFITWRKLWDVFLRQWLQHLTCFKGSKFSGFAKIKPVSRLGQALCCWKRHVLEFGNTILFLHFVNDYHASAEPQQWSIPKLLLSGKCSIMWCLLLEAELVPVNLTLPCTECSRFNSYSGWCTPTSQAITLDSVPKPPKEMLNQDFANKHPKVHCYFLLTVTYYILAHWTSVSSYNLHQTLPAPVLSGRVAF